MRDGFGQGLHCLHEQVQLCLDRVVRRLLTLAVRDLFHRWLIRQRRVGVVHQGSVAAALRRCGWLDSASSGMSARCARPAA